MSEKQKISQSDSLTGSSERPTLKTIARLTGLAVATVSRALNDAPDIGSATKKRVQAVANEIGYRPNRAGVRLRTGKTNVVSLVISTDHEMTNQHTGRLISSIAGALRGTPYHLIVTPYFPSEDPMAPVRYIVETQSADAIIMNQTEPDDPRIAYLLEQKFPFATHGRSNFSDRHSYYDFDNSRFGEIGIEQFAKRGRKSVLLIAPPVGQLYRDHMIDGATRRAKELGLKTTVLTDATSDSSTEQVEGAIKAHLTAHTETDAILCPSTLAAMTVAASAEDIGLVIGEDIDLCAKEATAFLRKFRSAIIAVNEDVATAGDFLARAVVQLIKDPTKPPMQGLETPTY